MKATHYTIEVRDREGKLLKRVRRKSHSFVQQWNELVCVQGGGKTALSIKDIDGLDRTVGANEYNLLMTSVAHGATLGIVAGIGSTAVAIADYQLATLCEQGTGENDLDYLVSSVADASVDGSECSFIASRSALNGSGGAITVAEIGVHLAGWDGEVFGFLGIRDVLAESIEVPDGGGITIAYTIKVSV